MSATEKDLIIKLPYRVGFWMIHADDTAGFFDDKVERARLKAVIERIAKHHESSGFVRNALANTLAHEDKWSEWAGGLDNIFKDCKAALQMVKAQSAHEDLQLYRVVIMQTAVCVAEAFQEDPNVPDLTGLTFATANDPGIPENISKKEKMALEELKKVLWG
ncbi:MAG: hypothetical protein ACAH83_11845 [Alphaproteobacteria bacterium]